MQVSAIGAVVLGLIVGLIVSVVSVQILAAMAPTWFASIADLVTAFGTPGTGDATADALGPIIATAIAIFGVVGLFALAGFYIFLNVRGRGASS